MPKLIMSDLDGTLVPEGSGALPQRLIDTLDRLQRAGIPFAVSSGRQHASIRRVFRCLEQEPLIVSLNGGCICRGDDCLYTDPMPQEAALAVAREASELPHCDVILETRDQCWVYNSTNGVDGELEVRQYHFAHVARLEDVQGEVIKVACYLTRDIDGFLSEAQRRWGQQLIVARSGERWVDFNVADKGKGLRAACQVLGIRPEETVAFGDNLNDAAMLTAAGVGWAVTGSNLERQGGFPTCDHPLTELEKILREIEKRT